MLSDYVYHSKYARSGENYADTIDRMLTLHPDLPDFIEPLLKDKQISSSQRALQFGGLPILEKNARLYNCSVSYCDRPDFFGQAFYLLLCGSGVGFSVQKHHVSQLEWDKGEGLYTHIIDDTIEGWSNAVTDLMSHYLLGFPKPVFDYSLIRHRKLRHGGEITREPLLTALTKVESVLDSAYTTWFLCRDAHSVDPLHPSSGSMLPITAFDITMHLADAVLSGGIRRSATIAVFSPDDERMMMAKTGDWFMTNPQRGRANISAMITPDTPKAVYDRVFKACKEFGEPAYIFAKSTEYINNPCVEITMCPTLITDSEGNTIENYTLDLVDPARRSAHIEEGYKFYTGFQLCNLTTINVERAVDLEECVRAATILGTHQARFTHLPYLGAVTERIVHRESLLGVSLTGILSKELPDLSHLSAIAVATNKEEALRIGIPQASRVTCVKPEGTASLVLGTSAGIHPYHSRRYIRRVQAKPYEECYRRYSETNPDSCLDSVWGNDLKVIEFACTAPSSAMVKADLSAVKHLSIAKKVNIEWVRNGTALPSRLEGANHNVSITISVNPDEWGEVQQYIWDNRQFFTGVSMLASSGDLDYEQAPYTEVNEDRPELLARFIELQKARPVDYTGVGSAKIEAADACSGGSCDLQYTMDKS